MVTNPAGNPIMVLIPLKVKPRGKTLHVELMKVMAEVS